MLILSRRPGESIMIGDFVEVLILSNHQGSVRVGIVAPREISIYRKEIYKKSKPINKSVDSDHKCEE